MIYDHAAERVVVGVCLNTRHGVGYLDLRPENFYVPQHASLYAACLMMRDVAPFEERMDYACDFSDTSKATMRSMVAESPVMFDAVSWATKVAGCARRRAAMHRCVETYEALRDGSDVDEAMTWS